MPLGQTAENLDGDSMSLMLVPLKSA